MKRRKYKYYLLTHPDGYSMKLKKSEVINNTNIEIYDVRDKEDTRAVSCHDDGNGLNIVFHQSNKKISLDYSDAANLRDILQHCGFSEVDTYQLKKWGNK